MIEIIPNWHPIFVHFTVGLLLTSALFHGAAILVSETAWKKTLTDVATWNLWAGTGFTVFTVLAGWYAFNTVTHDTPSHHIMLEHRNLALMTFAAFAAIAVWSFLRVKKSLPIHWPLVIAVAAAGILLISTAWHGGELVYRHGLGVMSLPNPEDHVHSEGEAHSHTHGEHAASEHEHEHDTATQSMHSEPADAATAMPGEQTGSEPEHEHSHDEDGHDHSEHEHTDHDH
jgi:uncharacterized membrane protein